MKKSKRKFQPFINYWLLPFLIGGSLAIGYKITRKALTRLPNQTMYRSQSLQEESVLTAKGKQYAELFF